MIFLKKIYEKKLLILKALDPSKVSYIDGK